MKNNGCGCKSDTNENMMQDKMSGGNNGMGGKMHHMGKTMMNKMMDSHQTNEADNGKEQGSNANPMKMGMGMMSNMMGKMKDENFNPMEMCKTMRESITATAKIASLATPEVQALFEDWVSEVEKEILNVIKAEGQINPSAIAEKLKITEDSALYFVGKLVRDKKIKVNVEPAESISANSSDAGADTGTGPGENCNCNTENK
ncbi:MAG: winged helix-turn-helix domain-containing protein [Candidatus Acididesulfobacter guangdongensis]|uniref:Winged helix-turn-helix domain-containing protein n=1 Tax=Acididesulfobacter guangdongensis TaxID=2597225 RepID=A0A519BEK2_ACIG2|nr:MAG: winged helix-turn-helix domain-containing protein [Candidatus Acididesulfobacter guangdongensis]